MPVSGGRCWFDHRNQRTIPRLCAILNSSPLVVELQRSIPTMKHAFIGVSRCSVSLHDLLFSLKTREWSAMVKPFQYGGVVGSNTIRRVVSGIGFAPLIPSMTVLIPTWLVGWKLWRWWVPMMVVALVMPSISILVPLVVLVRWKAFSSLLIVVLVLLSPLILIPLAASWVWCCPSPFMPFRIFEATERHVIDVPY